jgi:hypothetical protein
LNKLKLSTLTKLQEEVAAYYNSLQQRTGKTLCAKMFYSNLPEKADILFIGINPGGADILEESYTDVDTEERLAYVTPLWQHYALAKNTINLFELAGHNDTLQDMLKRKSIAKTNLYYLLTNNLDSLNSFRRTYDPEFTAKHVEWTNTIIELCEPKIIIYEGLALQEHCPPSHGDTIKTENMGSSIRYEFKNGSIGLMYARRYAGMRDKAGFAELLKVELDRLRERNDSY